jgi:hypothetical protein
MCIASASLESSVGCNGACNLKCVCLPWTQVHANPVRRSEHDFGLQDDLKPWVQLEPVPEAEHTRPQGAEAVKGKPTQKQLTRDWGSAYTEDCGGVHTA